MNRNIIYYFSDSYCRFSINNINLGDTIRRWKMTKIKGNGDGPGGRNESYGI